MFFRARENWTSPRLNVITSYSIHYTKLYDFIGQRKAEDTHNNQAIISLTPIHDANLLFDYKYNDRLGFFLNLYNLANQKYQIWNQYPVQGLNVMLGASYKF